jgi:hypothetical protein
MIRMSNEEWILLLAKCEKGAEEYWHQNEQWKRFTPV